MLVDLLTVLEPQAAGDLVIVKPLRVLLHQSENPIDVTHTALLR